MPDSKPSNSSSDAPRRRPFYRLPFFFTITSCVLFLLSIGCCLFGSYLLGLHEYEGPDGANKVAAEVTDWVVPVGFEGVQGIVIENSWVQFHFARFKQIQGRGLLVVAQLHVKGGQNPENRQLMEKSVEMIVPELKKIEPKTSEKLELVIRDQPTSFTLIQGEDRASTTHYRQVRGDFHGKLDDAVVILQCEDEFITPDELTSFVHSIK